MTPRVRPGLGQASIILWLCLSSALTTSRVTKLLPRATPAAQQVVPVPATHMHDRLEAEWHNVTAWPKHLLVEYRWRERHEVNAIPGLYLLFATCASCAPPPLAQQAATVCRSASGKASLCVQELLAADCYCGSVVAMTQVLVRGMLATFTSGCSVISC